MYKLLEGGIKKLKSALISVITTAGFDLKSPCYKLYEYCCNLLKGVFENDSQFVYIAQLDTADDLYKKENWIKANPILEYDEDALENLVPVANTARDMGGEDLRDFLVKQLNMWMQWSNALYIKDIKDWKRGAALRTLKDFRGSKCYVGVDLSSGGDLTSIAIVIPYMVDGVKKYFVHTHSFIPASRVDEHIKTDKVPYDVWISKGLVTVTETLGGIKTDYKYIIKYLEDLIKQNDLKPQLVCYDPHNASAFLSDLEALADIIIIDTGAGISPSVMEFLLSSPETIIVTTPEPTSVTDSYALLKALSMNENYKSEECTIRMVANRVDSESEGKNLYDKLNAVVTQFLGINMEYLGSVPQDSTVRKAVMKQKPVTIVYPNSFAARHFRYIAEELLGNEGDAPMHKKGIRSYFKNVFSRKM